MDVGGIAKLASVLRELSKLKRLELIDCSFDSRGAKHLGKCNSICLYKFVNALDLHTVGMSYYNISSGLDVIFIAIGIYQQTVQSYVYPPLLSLVFGNLFHTMPK